MRISDNNVNYMPQLVGIFLGLILLKNLIKVIYIQKKIKRLEKIKDKLERRPETRKEVSG